MKRELRSGGRAVGAVAGARRDLDAAEAHDDGRRGGSSRFMRRLTSAVALGAVLGVGSTRSGAAQEQKRTLGGRDVVVWTPASSAGVGRRPVIVFSHGFGGCAVSARFLSAALAARGYWVIGVNHHDAGCGIREFRLSPEEPFRAPARWSDSTYVDRADDVKAVLAALRSDPGFASRVDLERVGLVGHSLGGYTVLGLAGAWPAWRLPGVRAVLALSPYGMPFLSRNTARDISVPVMFQGGTRDDAITPAVKRPGGLYDRAPSPKYFVELAGAGHMAWTNVRPGSHVSVLAYAIPFLDRYVRGDTAGGAVLTGLAPGIATVRWNSELGAGERAAAAARPRP